jgi:hypothetical protein
MIAPNKLHAAIGNVGMGILGTDEFVILDLQSILFPAARLPDDM